MHVYPFWTILPGFLNIAIVLAYAAWAIHFGTRDALRRGKKPFIVVIACIFFFPWGLIAWFLFRPDPIDGDAPPPPFQLEDYRVQ